MLEEQAFDTGQVTLHYAESPGPRRALVMLHGISARWKTFLPATPQLQLRWHIYALDHRGHGLSGHVPNGYRFEAYIEDTLRFLEARTDRPAVLLGHSLGALVSIGVAARAPELARALVLEDPPLYGYRGERLRARPNWRLFNAWRDLAQQQLSLEALVDQLASVQPEADAAARRFRARSLQLLDQDVLSMYIDGTATAEYEIDELLPRITCPVLLLRGESALGGAIEDADEERACALLKQVSVVPVSRVGHNIHPVKPGLYSRTVSNFLEALSESAN